MELAFALFLTLGAVIAFAAVIVGIPLVLGLMAWDVAQDRKQRAFAVEDAHAHIAVERGVARAFVIVGGLFWSLAIFADVYSRGQGGAGEAALSAILPFGACLVTLVIGWYWERITAAALMLASVAVVAWGVVYAFDAKTWVIMTVMLIGPMVTASVLFWLARREQEAYEYATALRPQLAFALDARSTLG
ncbi:MAG: hypothetical protein EG823_08485 [Actinobacteria bacterium]|nr:hypothetical protein [Actinomycetota bacterium]